MTGNKRQPAVLCVLAVAAVLFALPPALHAADVEIHGYGNQDFIMSNKNQYLNAQNGTWEHNTMSLVFTGKVTDDTAVWAKIFAESERTTMEWLYVDYKLGGFADLRAGQMKFPLGIYNLIRDNKFLQLTELEPFMYSENVDMIFENFRGVGLEYNGAWFDLELIGGAPELEEQEEGGGDADFSGTALTTTSAEVETRTLIGGRLTIRTPVEGLAFLFSAAQFEEEARVTTTTWDAAAGTVTATVDLDEGKEKIWIASLDLNRHPVQMKAEYAVKKGIDEEMTSYFAEAGYTFAERATPYVRYDYIAIDDDQKSDASFYQKDITVGVGYRINDYFKVKVEEHFMTGYAMPVATGEVAPGSGSERWNLFVAGVNFIF